jgi:hypothetical protein
MRKFNSANENSPSGITRPFTNRALTTHSRKQNKVKKPLLIIAAVFVIIAGLWFIMPRVLALSIFKGLSPTPPAPPVLSVYVGDSVPSSITNIVSNKVSTNATNYRQGEAAADSDVQYEITFSGKTITAADQGWYIL